MGHKSYLTRLVSQIELVEVEYPDEYDEEDIALYNEMVSEGAEADDMPEEVSLSVIQSVEMTGERLEGWEDEDEYMPVAEDMIATVKEYKYNLEQFLWYLESLSGEEYFKFMVYLTFSGYTGSEDEKVEAFHKRHYPK